MGFVYEALDQSRGVRVAIKTLRHLSPDGLIRFKNEFGSGGVTYDFFELDLRRCLNATE
jgi:hypothetical protein